MLKTLIAAFAALLVLPFAGATGASAPGPVALVEKAAIEITNSDETTVADAVLAHLDIPVIARFTLGRYAKSLTETELMAYEQAFERYMRRQITANADAFVDVQVSITNTSRRNARDAVVTTQIAQAGEMTVLRWRVIERGGAWSVVDLEFAGLWLAIEQRAQVSAILDRPRARIEDVIAQLG